MKKSDLRREIKKKSSSYTDEQLFGSDYYQDILEGYVISVCERLHRIPNIHAYYDPNSDSTAQTDGNVIYQNTAGPLIRELDTRWKKHISNVGHTTHECGHILFTDFKNLNPLRDGWRKQELVFYPTTPVGGEEVKEYLDMHPNFKNVFVQIMDNLVNILEDIYEENCCYQYFDGLCAAGLKLANDQIFEKSKELATMLNAVLLGNVFLPHVITTITHLTGMGYEVKQNDELSQEMLDLKQDIDWFFHENKETIESLHWESDGIKRCMLFNKLFVELYRLMPQPPENEDMSESESQQVQNNQKGDGTEMPQGNTEGLSPKSLDQNAVEEAKENAKSMAASNSTMERYQQQDAQSIAESELILQEEMNHTKELEAEAKAIGHDFFNGYKFERKIKVDAGNIRNYNRIYSDIQKTSKNLVRKISNILKERQTEGYDSGYLMGQRFNAKDVFHNDGKYFSKQLVPDGQPDVAFGVLIDESGSMEYNDNWKKARQVAILFEDVLRQLNIPTIICGHDSDYHCILHSYVDFDTIDNNDKYRLVDIQARYGNIDGAAITYVGNKLLQRPEQRKVLIVISDGEPAGCSFYDSDDCNKDTTLAAQKYRKLGINVFGAIVDEYDSVAEIYDKKYAFDCRKDETLEKELIKLIKRYVLAK